MWRCVQVLLCLLVFKTALVTFANYPDYFPANFRADFLLGREGYFHGSYQWAFYAHIVTGPLVLLAGLVLLCESLRRRFPRGHRRLGQAYLICVIGFIVPSGLWMSRYAESGTIAGVGFAALAIVTAVCASMGWRAAIARKFEQHRAWMLRCYVLLCSAVVLRIIGGASDLMDLEWTYPLAAWASWLLPLLALEVFRPNLHLFASRNSEYRA
jgi:hypothetical protein